MDLNVEAVMRKLFFSIFLILLGVAATGCDSGSNDGDNGIADAEVFIGSWQVNNLRITNQGATQDVTALLLTTAGIKVLIDFESNAFDISVDNGDSTTTFMGTYSVNDTQKTVVLTSSDFNAPITIQYQIDSNNQITLDTDDVALFAELTGFDLVTLGIPVDSITLVVQRTGLPSLTF